MAAAVHGAKQCRSVHARESCSVHLRTQVRPESQLWLSSARHEACGRCFLRRETRASELRRQLLQLPLSLLPSSTSSLPPSIHLWLRTRLDLRPSALGSLPAFGVLRLVSAAAAIDTINAIDRVLVTWRSGSTVAAGTRDGRERRNVSILQRRQAGV